MKQWALVASTELLGAWLDAIVSQKALNTKCAVNGSAVLVNKTKIHFTKTIMFCTQKFVENSITQKALLVWLTKSLSVF